ncbi:MAG: hypothetical protein LC722_06710 [Actinobacteria bacterium]|nr:hypothetical protein [Actinomycetota bacterium]
MVTRRLAAAITLLILSACADRPAPDLPSGSGISTVAFQVESGLLRRTLTEIGLTPPALKSGAKRPLLVWLPGRGGVPTNLVEQRLMAPTLDQLDERAPVVVVVDGGGTSYYHDRDDGPWGTYVTQEVIPEALERFDVDPGRVAIGGISMGGFGALDLARLNPGDFCAIGGHSAAVFGSFAGASSVAFDDQADFAAHDLLSIAGEDPHLFGRTPIWIDVGESDPFWTAVTALATSLGQGRGDVTYSSWPGGHDSDYWRQHMPAYLDFYADALANCA